MSRVDYWSKKPELQWLKNGGGVWDRRLCIMNVAALLNKPRVLEIGVDNADVLHYCHNVFGSYTGVDVKVSQTALNSKGLECPFEFVESKSVYFWKSLDKDDLFDLVYVDGDHTKVASHLDITQAMLRLSPGGYILAHDMNDNDAEQDIGPAWSYNRVCNLPGWYARLLEGHGEGMGIFFKDIT